MVDYRRLGRVFGVARRGQTYRNLVYLLVVFPLGMLHFVTFAVGFSLGAGLAVLGVGLIVLWLTFGYAWCMAYVERFLAIRLLRVDIGPLSTSGRFSYPWRWRDLRRHLSRPITWKSLLYLTIECPLGVATFTLTVSLLAISLSLLFYPVGGVVALATSFSTGGAGHAGTYGPFTLTVLIWQHVPQPLALVLVLLLFSLAPVLGVYATGGTLWVLNETADCWGQFARFMLGLTNSEQQLTEARTRAAREEARAERSDLRRRELIVNVSHELRTPIANIRGHVESLRPPMSERLSEDDKQSYLAIVAREADRLSTLVDDLLALARADADELHLEVRPVDVCAIVEEVYQVLAPLAHRDRQVTLVRNVAPDLPGVMADRDRLAQVLLNLARNAITATPAGGIVFIDVEQADDGHVSLTVSDTGHGIPPEDLDRVFERFYRADAARQRATGGFGLGLSIVRDLVQAMGGAVSATSTVNVGSSFRVLLRVAAAAHDSGSAGVGAASR